MIILMSELIINYEFWWCAMKHSLGIPKIYVFFALVFIALKENHEFINIHSP